MVALLPLTYLLAYVLQFGDTPRRSNLGRRRRHVLRQLMSLTALCLHLLPRCCHRHLHKLLDLRGITKFHNMEVKHTCPAMHR